MTQEKINVEEEGDTVESEEEEDPKEKEEEVEIIHVTDEDSKEK